MQGRVSKRLALGIVAFALLSVGAIAVLMPRSGENIAASASANAKNALRILPLGDSITQADANHLGYRYRLWIKLIDAGVNFDFVGSSDDNYFRNPEWPPYKGRTFDRDHEGHWGWCADEILNGPAGDEKNKLLVWLQGYTPDIVLMHLGSNDVFHFQDAAETAGELAEIINVLRADNNRVIILLAKIIPTKSLGANEGIEELNTQIEKMAGKMTADQSPVVIVDQYAGFKPEADIYDSIHPNQSGEEKMAAKWFEAIRKCTEKSWNTNEHE
ncbi:MAG: cellulose-binding protein [Candidatus Lindowbacteria bacterium]|nr:cellulose-binding protein [Candidatus Lindowbacteria bacterium]